MGEVGAGRWAAGRPSTSRCSWSLGVSDLGGASEFHAGIGVVLQPSGVAAALPAAKCLCLNFKARGVPSIQTPVPKSPESLAPTTDTQQPGDLERSSREIDSRSLKWTTE